MKKTILLLFLLAGGMAFAQPDDEVEYYTDANVKYSRFKIALLANPNFTDRRLINDEVTAGGGFDLTDDKAKGSFQLNYNLDLIYTIGAAFDISAGIGYATADYTVENLILYQDSLGINISDTVNADLDVSVGMFTVPIKLNFNTTIGDLFDLEVVPAVDLVFINKYEQTFSPVGSPEFKRDRTDETQSINYNVGIGLGGTYRLTDNLGLVVRANIKYMLNPMIEKPGFPRETIYSYGANVGLSYKF